jgi:membrane protein DedA with SNARE-associated domain
MFIPVVIVGGLFYWFVKDIGGLDGILTFIKEWQIVGYMILGFFSFGGSLVWTAAAGMAAALGAMNIYVALSVGIVFNYIGDMFLFYLGKYQKEEIKPYFEKHKRKIALSTLIMRKYGVLAIFIQKFLYGIKTLVPISMALSRYDFKKFGFYNVFASIFFVSVIMLGSYYSAESIRGFFTYFSENQWIPFAFLVGVIGLIWYGMEHLTRRK